VLVGVIGQLLDTGHDLGQDGINLVVFSEVVAKLCTVKMCVHVVWYGVVCGVWCGVVCGVWCVVWCVVWCTLCVTESSVLHYAAPPEYTSSS